MAYLLHYLEMINFFSVMLVILQVSAIFIHVVSTFHAALTTVRQKTAANCNFGDLECPIIIVTTHVYLNF